MWPVSNEPGEICAIAKTNKFDLLENITIQSLKFCIINIQIFQIFQTCTYNAAKVPPDYLRLLRQNEYKISDLQGFASQIKEKLH